MQYKNLWLNHLPKYKCNAAFNNEICESNWAANIFVRFFLLAPVFLYKLCSFPPKLFMNHLYRKREPAHSGGVANSQ